jgi:Icc-related predicted phosphoesterase
MIKDLLPDACLATIQGIVNVMDPIVGQQTPGARPAWTETASSRDLIDRPGGFVRLLTVSDLHQRRDLYALLASAVQEHRPDIVAIIGDFLDVPGTGGDQIPVPACARALADLETPEIVLVRGNHETSNFIEFAESFSTSGRAMVALHGEAHSRGPLVIIGFPCLLGDDFGFTLDKSPIPPHPSVWLPRLMKARGPACRAIWLAHEPVTGIFGSSELREMVDRFQPMLVVHGHDHQSPIRSGRWHQRIGQTEIVNVGQSDEATLCYTVIDAEFHSSRAGLPRRMTVTGFPWKQALELPPR